MITGNSTIEEIIDDFIKSNQLQLLGSDIEPKLYIIAKSKTVYGDVYAYCLRNKKWVITTDFTNPSKNYMCKETGLIGYTDKIEDFEKNLFDDLGEAIDCFWKFYKK
jgi:hypothetical protein